MLLYRDPEAVETAIRYVIAMCRSFPEQYEKAKTDRELMQNYLWNVHHVNFVFNSSGAQLFIIDSSDGHANSCVSRKNNAWKTEYA